MSETHRRHQARLAHTLGRPRLWPLADVAKHAGRLCTLGDRLAHEERRTGNTAYHELTDAAVPDSFAKVCLRAFGWFVCKVRDY